MCSEELRWSRPSPPRGTHNHLATSRIKTFTPSPHRISEHSESPYNFPPERPSRRPERTGRSSHHLSKIPPTNFTNASPSRLGHSSGVLRSPQESSEVLTAPLTHPSSVSSHLIRHEHTQFSTLFFNRSLCLKTQL